MDGGIGGNVHGGTNGRLEEWLWSYKAIENRDQIPAMVWKKEVPRELLTRQTTSGGCTGG